jgi:hypothetical protein
MTSHKSLIVLAAAAGALCLAACETDYDAAPASTAAQRSAVDANRACRPGDTEAGTRSGLGCTSGSSTGTPSGNDANIKGAGSAGSAPAVPDTH